MKSLFSKIENTELRKIITSESLGRLFSKVQLRICVNFFDIAKDSKNVSLKV